MKFVIFPLAREKKSFTEITPSIVKTEDIRFEIIEASLKQTGRHTF